jgi:GNAT superfamily N-acetyltransferase
MTDYRLTSALDAAAEEEITQRLVAYNLRHTADQPATPQPPQPLQLFAWDDTGALVGGLIARTHSIPFWLEISILWVDEAQRGHGLGRRLMEQCEREASQRGCRYARLATSDYQAPEFYPKLGYIRYGALADCPPGETVSYFWKPLPLA